MKKFCSEFYICPLLSLKYFLQEEGVLGTIIFRIRFFISESFGWPYYFIQVYIHVLDASWLISPFHRSWLGRSFHIIIEFFLTIFSSIISFSNYLVKLLDLSCLVSCRVQLCSSRLLLVLWDIFWSGGIEESYLLWKFRMIWSCSNIRSLVSRIVPDTRYHREVFHILFILIWFCTWTYAPSSLCVYSRHLRDTWRVHSRVQIFRFSLFYRACSK